jgi:PIN domain nuclease of toxin-antitoxin system
VLDAMAIIAALAREPARPEVEILLRDDEDRPRIAAVNLAEVIDVLVRVKSFPRRQVGQAVSWLQAGGLAVVATDERIAQVAGDLRARHYHRINCAVSICDCVALATAQTLGEGLATADPALASVARADGTPLIPLPDSRGRRP